MKLWLLKRKCTGYDEALGFVIRAESSTRAREMAARRAGDEADKEWREASHNHEPIMNRESNPWLDPTESTCRRLDADGSESVLLRSFNAG
jgi:hypothetical protein